MRKRIRDPGIFLTRDPGWKKFESGIRDKHPGSATLPKSKTVIDDGLKVVPVVPHRYLESSYITFF
jgi:hypothetical protein